MKKHIKLLAAVLGTLLLTILASVFLFNATPKSKRIVYTVELDYGLADPAARRTLGLLTGRPVVAGNSADVLLNGEEIFPAKLGAIRGAERSITFETYEYWGEEIAGAYAEALAEAAERGVRVHAILDYIGSRQADPEFFRRMEDAGVEIVRWRQPSWYQMSRFNHRTHRKLLVIDGREAYIGGANVADAWAGTPEEGGYRDYHFRLRGPVVGHLQSAFLENWLDARGELLHGDLYFPEIESAGDMDMQAISSSPREGHHHMRKLFLYAFAAAEERIRIGTAFFYPDSMMLEALLAARERGVEVEVLVPGPEMSVGSVRDASKNRWGKLLEGSVRIFEYQPAMYHSKIIIVDDRWVSIGSTNMDNRSFRINDEANVNIYDEGFAAAMNEIYEADLAESVEYDIDRWNERSWYSRLRGWAARRVGPHL